MSCINKNTATKAIAALLFLSMYTHIVTAQETENTNGKLSIPSASKVTALKSEADTFKDKTLVFKGFYLGMPIGDAAELMNYYFDEAVFQTKKDDDGTLRIKKEGEGFVWVEADGTGHVTAFNFKKELVHKMFNSEKTPRLEFLQMFIDAYDIPTLEPAVIEWTFMGFTTIGTQSVYSHRSDKGYEVKFFEEIDIYDHEKAIQAAFSGQPITESGGGSEGSMSLTKIQTAAQRQSAFD